MSWAALCTASLGAKPAANTITRPRAAATRAASFRFAADRSAAALRALDRRAVRYDQRAHGIRLSPHVYNTADEIDEFLAALAAALPARDGR